ncbi:MAG: alpha/beta hydrolase, partial [Syntrophomonadaceae bacterium]|nr:alpha/beta hydrolase [Syntrophomonadaceae bacterium]
MQERYVTSERGKTYYWISSNQGHASRTLVFLPGLTADHRLFDLQVKAFAKDYVIIVWDAPAHGKSRPYNGFSYANLADELRRILEVESIGQAVLVGQSAGGFVAQSFIKKHPDMVEGFLGIGTCPYGPVYYSKWDFWWLKQIEWMAHLFPDTTLRTAMAKMCCITARGQRNMLDMLRTYDKDELCHLMYLGFTGLIEEVCHLEIPCPVWLLVGERDKTGKVRQY